MYGEEDEMSTVIRPEISKKNPYYISKHRYYELKHFCLQYPEWKRDYLYLGDLIKTGNFSRGEKSENNPVESAVSKRLYVRTKMETVEKAAKQADSDIGDYILKAVTEDLSFVQLKMQYEIPCERDMYYDRYRKFFYILNLTLNNQTI